jgi:transposase
MCARFSTRFSMCSSPTVSGRLCRKTCRPRAPRIPISCFGTGAGRWSAFTKRSISPYIAVREAAGREASLSAAIIDSQSAKAAQKGGATIDPQGFDAGRKVTGCKRHVHVDTLDLLLGVSVLPANIQDRDGAHSLLRRARRRLPFIKTIFVGAGYQGPKMARTVIAAGCWKIQIVKPSDAMKGFVVEPKRWIVERTLAWIAHRSGPGRRLEDDELAGTQSTRNRFSDFFDIRGIALAMGGQGRRNGDENRVRLVEPIGVRPSPRSGSSLPPLRFPPRRCA